MTTFHAHITIVNNTSDVFTLDTSASSGINTHGYSFPTQLNANSTTGPFEQGFDLQINFTAVYVDTTSTASPQPQVALHMYGDGAQVFTVQIKQTPSSPQPFPASTCDATGSTSATFTIAN